MSTYLQYDPINDSHLQKYKKTWQNKINKIIFCFITTYKYTRTDKATTRVHSTTPERIRILQIVHFCIQLNEIHTNLLFKFWYLLGSKHWHWQQPNKKAWINVCSTVLTTLHHWEKYSTQTWPRFAAVFFCSLLLILSTRFTARWGRGMCCAFWVLTWRVAKFEMGGLWGTFAHTGFH